MPVAFFDIRRQNQSIKNEIASVISRVIDSGRFILGENVAGLEKEIAAYCGAKFAVGLASGTDALHLALRACGIKEGDEVITSPFTFVATAEAIAYCGATPIFVDIEPKTFNLLPSAVKKAVTKRTRAVLPVHLYGQACDMAAIMDISRNHGLFVIEDCAQAIGAEYKGIKVGSFGQVGCFSFFPTKNLGCFGDGGMVVSNDEKIVNEIKVLRGHGSRKTYHYDIVGYNSRLDELQAAVLRLKLVSLENYTRLRLRNAALYHKHLKNIRQISLPFEQPERRHVFNQFTIRVKDRDGLFEFLKSKGIGSMVYYPLSLHLQKAFAALGNKPGAFPESEAAQEEVLSLPIYPELAEPEIDEVCSAINEYYRK